MKIIPDNETAKGSRRHRNHTATQRLRYLRQWEASGATAEAFAKLYPINAESLYRWRMKEKSGKLRERQSSGQAFRELKIAQTPSPEPSQSPTVTLKSSALEISLAGVELNLRLCAFLKSLSKEVFDV